MEQDACSRQACSACGVDRRMPLTCPQDNTTTLTVKLRVFKEVPRTTADPSKVKKKERTEKELVEVSMTGAELMQGLCAVLKTYLPHRLRCIWDLHHRRLHLETYLPNRIVIKTDFSANYDCDPGTKLNSATSEHAILDVFMVSRSPEYVTLENAVERRYQQNDVWCFWATKQKGRLGTDNFTHGKCLRHILHYYREVEKIVFDTVSLFTDGSPPQYKCRKNCQLIAQLAVDFDIRVEQQVAPTANFKTNVDGEGMVEKYTMRRLERAEVEGARAKNARGVFEALKLHMEPPALRDIKTCPLQTVTRRFQRLLVDVNNAIEGDEEAEDVIITDYEHEKYDCVPMGGKPGIASTYMFATTPQLGTGKVLFKTLACWCAACMRLDDAGCLFKTTTGPWSVRDIVPLAASAASAADPQADEEELSLHAAYNNFVEGDDEGDDEGGDEGAVSVGPVVGTVVGTAGAVVGTVGAGVGSVVGTVGSVIKDSNIAFVNARKKAELQRLAHIYSLTVDGKGLAPDLKNRLIQHSRQALQADSPVDMAGDLKAAAPLQPLL
ncbi:hypothetical protein B484DRAFT_427184 [Ochromonadaceae sp. CCMP2298]|nr:hypothetical protein B484DRAFT_427184 [Ochromonadaceae sp. CCMP2298]